MMQGIRKEAPPETGNWTSRLARLPVQPRIQALNSILKYFPDCEWAKKSLTLALAESGAIEKSIELASVLGAGVMENELVADLAERACQHGWATRLLDHTSELGSIANREAALRWICPALARSDEAEACRLANTITAPEFRALTLALVAKTMLDNRPGEEKPDP